MLKKLIERLRPPIYLTVNVTTIEPDEDSAIEHDNRVSELLNHNNEQLEENRVLRRILAQAVHVVEQNHSHHKDYGADYGYEGSDLDGLNSGLLSAYKDYRNGR